MIPLKEMIALACVIIIGSKGLEIADAFWNAKKYDRMLMQSLDSGRPKGGVDLLVKSPATSGGTHSGVTNDGEDDDSAHLEQDALR